MSSRSIAVVIPFLMSLAVHTAATRADQDRYGHLHMTLERTWFNVDVARVDLWFGPATRDIFGKLASSRQYSDALAEQIAQTAMQSTDVQVQVELLRNGSMHEFMDAVHDNLVHARDAHYISDSAFPIALQSVQTDFAPLASRGLKKGDRIMYKVRDGSLQTIVTAGDRVLLDITSQDPNARTAMLAGYFAPKTDFREKLIKSLF